MPSALATAREDLITRIGGLYELTIGPDADLQNVRDQALGALVGAERLVRGPEGCNWKNAVKGLYMQIEADKDCKRLGWALAQYNIYLVHALHAPAALPRPVRALDPNSETYMCM